MEKDKVYEILNEAYFGENPHEEGALGLLPKLLEGATLFFDVGASLGQYSLAAARLMKGGTVVGIEADPLRFEELERNYAKWSAQHGVTMVARHAAASGEAGTVTFHSSGSNLSGGLNADVKSTAGGDVVWSEVEVAAVSLDDVAREFGRDPDFVKMDIEGGEAHAIPGSREILARGRTVFWIELHPHVKVEGRGADGIVRAMMKEHGYEALMFHGKVLFGKNLQGRFGAVVWKRKVRRLIKKAVSLVRGGKKERTA